MALASNRDLVVHIDPEALLLQSHGFLVDAIPDEPVGVVDDVLVDENGRPRALVVSSGWFGRRRLVVPAEDVAEICPRDRRLRLRRAASAFDADTGRD
jgi:hypothetical protein